ncbi:MAG: phosphopyruvate hydratase [Ruminococcaceae bacterium]|nr:phosphopyruvate hydratase [Oscillospiraceae bacterium]
MKQLKTTIEEITARQIFDSRGNPTVEAQITLSDGTRAIGCAPSGASTGDFEALELRDNDNQYCGKGVLKAVANVKTRIAEELKGKNAADLQEIDSIMLKLDGTKEKKNLGANAILSVSCACAKAAAQSMKIPLYRFLGGVNACTLPMPMMNILNGGAHASNTVDVQEFMIMPVGAPTFKECMRFSTEIYHSLAGLLKKRGLAVSVGDEGGFAPNLESDEEALECIIEAAEKAGYKAGTHFLLAMDAAASEWKTDRQGYYRMPKSGKEFTSETLIDHWQSLSDKYPLFSLEDGLDQEDWKGWELLTKRLGSRLQLVGDDLFVTNSERLKKGISSGCGNSILIKLNQIGTVSETLDAIKTAQRAGYTTVISHRSGETEDSFIADLAVAVNSGQIKTGAPCRSERVSKYNRLLRIEEQLGKAADFPGTDYFLNARGGKAE